MTRSQLLLSTDRSDGDMPRYSLRVASDPDEVLAAQRLRHRVFAEEMGAQLEPGSDGLDVDHYDEFCDHLVVIDDATDEIVGTYRMLPPDRARDAGGLYSDTEFHLGNLDPLRGSLVETGRSCVDARHRTGAVVSLVWAGIARYMLLSGHRYLAGCASVPLSDGGALAAGVWDIVRSKHFADEAHRVSPRHAWDGDEIARPARPVLPPLLRGYVRLGAQVCGAPAHDPAFGVADFFVLLDLQRVDERYLKFFLGIGS
ncbi:GNAT family N-acetyltransferase [Saccharomonospora sp. CUA-673]|uniref:GNAT family N-acetyltransferase n=1 Tax=Saccharomonospora sp. CUA-673 TaxID=1904969 RepID=UPI00095A0CAF|nr:GNAT family N-acyltransferase [Saccharomonospora sp. CUA-673]OLT48541.1 GNAT family N-acetyltransferase [Saccharomonospora sp. CUA-673]